MNRKFNVNDAVCLSAQPRYKMTIENQNTDGTYHCMWLNRRLEQQHTDYDEKALIPWQDPISELQQRYHA